MILADSLSIRLGHRIVAWSITNRDSNHTTYQAVRTVDIGQTASGAIVVAWRAEPESSRHVDMGDILCAISHDDGQTWAPPICIAASNTQWAYANVVLHTHGRVLHAFIGRCPASSPHSEQQEIISRISRDDGATWTGGGLEMHYPHPTIGGGKVIRFGDRFLMPFHRNDHGFANKTDQNISQGQYPLLYKEKPIRLHGVLVSDDLRNWQLGGIVPQSPGTPATEAFLQEGFLAPANDGSGELLLVMREGDWQVSIDPQTGKPGPWNLVSATGSVFVSRSADGLNWTPAEPWPDIPNHNTKGAFLTDSRGRQVTLYNDAPDRERLFAMVCGPNQNDWSSPLPLAGCSNEQGEWHCYAMAIEDASQHHNSDETRLLAVYEAGKQRVVFQELFVRS